MNFSKISLCMKAVSKKSHTMLLTAKSPLGERSAIMPDDTSPDWDENGEDADWGYRDEGTEDDDEDEDDEDEDLFGDDDDDADFDDDDDADSFPLSDDEEDGDGMGEDDEESFLDED